MKKIIIFVSFILLLGACTKCVKEHNHKGRQKALEGKIVVVIDSIPDTRRKNLLNGGASSSPFMCSYINDEFELISYLYPSHLNTCDTIVIYTTRDAICFSSHFQGSLSTINFCLEKNKLYNIGYRDSIPYLKNNDDFSHINCYYHNLYSKIFVDKVSAECKLSNVGPLLFIEFESFPPPKNALKKGLSTFIDQLENEVTWQERCLDSLYKYNKISEADYILLKSEIDLKKQSFNQSIRDNNLHFFDDFQDRYRADWDFNYSEIETDSNIYYNSNYYKLLSNHYNADRYIYDGTIYSVAVLDSILKTIPLPSTLIKLSNSQFLDRVYSESPWDIIQKNSQEYLNLYPSSELPVFLQKKYSIDPNVTNDVVLVNPQGKTTTLGDVLEELKGKEIVLDIWATWCSPCIAKIKSEQEIREENKREGVEYVFITFMDNRVDWNKKIKELKLDKEKHCYFTTNSQTSQWFNNMKVTSIPYVIKYNKSGVVIGQEK